MKSIILFLLLFSCTVAHATGDDSTSKADSSLQVQNLINSLGLSAFDGADTALIFFVRDWMGVKYCYGGNSRAGVDCSGFANVVYKQVFGITLPRISTDIYRQSNHVKKKNLKQGDLVFFKTNGRSRVNHVGVYLWDGYFVHSSTKYGVIISKLDEGYYERTFVSGGRY